MGAVGGRRQIRPVNGVFDASALLAVILAEPGSDIAMLHMRGSCVSAINVVEVIQRMDDHGVAADAVLQQLARLEIEIIPFEVTQAPSVAELRAITKHKGVSLADRVCLALAKARNMPVFTTDRVWAELGLDIDIRLLR